MKYNELLNFEPITEVVKFSRTSDTEYQKSLIKTFVFSKDFSENLIPLIVKNLNYTNKQESFGLQIVGNYGTGKSHLMSLISLIAENKDLIELITNENPKKELEEIAGKFKVLRFELGNQESLWEVISFKIEDYLSKIGISFTFDGHGPISYFDKIQLMMADFEEVYPDKGFMIVIDEMLAYLKGRSTADKLNSDLQVLQALGQACDSSKFKFVFGVQEMIYQSSEFQFAAEMLQKVNDRYKDITITKEDVAFIVKNRLLKKDEHQKQKIKKHLDDFLMYFTDLHARTEHYVDLFPVHPAYFENFEKIKIGKSQREILKTLSNQFLEILETEVPSDNPGLLTYDKYWQDIQKSPDLMAIPDVRRVKEVTDTIIDKIDTYFTGARESKKEIAQRITNACAIRILQHDLNKQNGTNTEHLVDDLCLTDKLASDRDFLIDIMDSTAKQIITATSGQYFDKNAENQEYHLRIEGGVNFDQKIKDYAASMDDSQKDEFFYKFLEINMTLDHDTYRSGFKIWEHAIEWKSHKSYRDGYIFFGNPNEKSTTQPKQHFYMYFMPIFDSSKKKRNHDKDEVYFIMEDISEDFKNSITLYGAALSLEVRSDSTQKPIYRQKIEELNKKARTFFDNEFINITKVDYMGKELPLSSYTLPGKGATKEQIFSDVTSFVLEDWFVEENPKYPNFSQLNGSITKDNFHRLIKQALLKIEKQDQPNRDGEGILSGLGLWVPGRLDISFSEYAQNIIKLLNDKGTGMVLNRDEILECVHVESKLWISKDFKIEAELEFLVLACLTALGDIEITLSSGKTINSTNLNELKDVSIEDYFGFAHVKHPKGVNEAALKAMFLGVLGKDLSKHLKDDNTYIELGRKASEWAQKTVTVNSKIQGGYIFKGVEIISENDARNLNIKFTGFSGFCDKLKTYNSEARIKNFQFSLDEVNLILESKPLVEKVEKQLDELKAFDDVITYLNLSLQFIADIDLKGKINLAIEKLSDVISSGDDNIISNYKKELQDLKTKYATYYLEQYLKYRISEKDNTLKEAVLDSNEKIINDILKEADFLPSAQYTQLLNKIDKLKPADSKVNMEAILEKTYHDFNPLDYVDQGSTSIQDLKLELKEIYNNWVIALKEILDDPIVKKNIGLLDKEKITLLENFKNDTIQMEKSNALSIRNAIMELHKGLEKVELSTDSLKTAFNKPLSPEEAIVAFKYYIDEVCRGKERDKIRIILK
jgi:energy-coupling factor transporter ATP-binding protein EcfA2